MVLYLIGLGLYDERDITLRGLDAVRGCARIYLEAYTSILLCDKLRLEALYGKPVVVADREMVENDADLILEGADQIDVAFLVVGDPFGATTHTDLQLRARERGIPVRVIHNASVMNAVGACGLQLYKFGESVSIVFFTDTWRPDSFYDKIAANRKLGLHTLCLLDIKVKEPNLEALCRGKTIYEPPRYMSIKTALEQLLEIEEKRREGAYDAGTLAVGMARVGAPDQRVVAGGMRELMEVDFGAPLHCLIIAGNVHVVEEEILGYYRIGQAGAAAGAEGAAAAAGGGGASTAEALAVGGGEGSS
ncbi:diphthine synthase [Monoraphidium neglectum]|uniref:diphthine methyl ester synthase n=1 Tax=Monoraphidium neglectum TaxID=145388 RepID=A0A0D2IYJ0_9CHLO|nr:diphthine synthase [Monoraphidium neglectum]KIY92977.1 diphthine synthase [Monoraphidium neglectum]|eukprot:XP_013891997.1 diphthine synthase [Monoraphidium neglectum]